MSSYNRIAAVKTTVAILRHLADQKGPVSGQDVARAVDAPHGTVMCHLATLEDERLVRAVGGVWELDMGLALFWARKKSQLHGQVERATADLSQLGV